MTLIGILTWYIYLTPSPLRCGGTYLDISTPWIAMDIDAGHAVCGDLVTVIGPDGIPREFVVRDSGPLSSYCVETPGGCVPIIGDVPKHGVWWEGLSIPVTITNETMYSRARDSSVRP